MSDRGELLIISAPSGSGKTTLAYRLVERMPNVVFSRSTTTRPPRPDESDGVDYDFVSEEEFDRLVEQGAFLEWARVVENRYGTPDAFVERTVSAGNDVVLNIDIQGALAVRKKRPDAVLIFLLPPSFDELRRRLTSRTSGGSTNVRTRLETGLQEVLAIEDFDYVVVNDDLEEALLTLESIVRSRRSQRDRMRESVAPILESFRNAREQGFDTEP